MAFTTKRGQLQIGLHDVLDCELRPMQFSVLRSILASENRALRAQTPMAFIKCAINGYPCELRFHIQGAMTIPGESEKARRFRDALSSAKFHYAQAYPVTQQLPPPSGVTHPLSSLADAADPTALANADAPPNPMDIPALIQQLAALRDAEILTEDEFAHKKADLLSRL